MQDVGAIESAARVGDRARLVAAAHLLKGSAQNLGVTRVGQLCQALEDFGLEGSIEDAIGLVPDLRRHVDLARRALRALL